MATRRPKRDTNEYPFKSQEGHIVTGRIIKETPKARKPRKFLYNTICKECGQETLMNSDQLKGKKAIQSCGCILSKQQSERSKIHGMSGTVEHKAWSSMKTRCYRKTCKDYVNYGGRGIKVCDRWLNSFENFYEDMGRRPEGRSIDRIDVNGNYEPSNCRWATFHRTATKLKDK